MFKFCLTCIFMFLVMGALKHDHFEYVLTSFKFFTKFQPLKLDKSEETFTKLHRLKLKP